MIVILPTQVQFPQVTYRALSEYIIVMASSPVDDNPCYLKILGFTIGTILKMTGSTLGLSPRNVIWKKK
jgi:hypothetical protein